MGIKETLQQALNKPYSLPFFSQSVLQQVFGSNLTIHSSALPMPVNPSEERMVKWIRKYGEIKLTDYRQVDLYEVGLDSSIIVERNKVSIGNVVKKLIAGNNAVLANFYYPEEPDRSWRFSFIAKDQIIEGGEAKKVETNPKRYTYILGTHERCRTAAERFEKLSLNTEFDVDKLKEAFSVEKLSKKFFDEYKEHYDLFVKHLSKREIKLPIFMGDEKAVRDFAKKLLGRIVFLYFVQKKGWLGASDEKWNDGNTNFMEDLFNSSGKRETFYPLWLRTLFYDSLNNPARTANNFKLPNGKIVKVPYLNGGLYEDDDPKGTLTFPPRLFEDLFEFFNQYNFTIYEDSPDDHTVAVDPEMLGHIFENLLEDNKDKGAYYTPKEIVHYMCQESLIEYLATKLEIPESISYQELGTDQTQMFGNEVKKGQLDILQEHKVESPGITRNDVEQFIKYKRTTPQILKHANEINTFLDEVKICDPAIGSGAFPMGLLHEIFNAKQVLRELSDIQALQDVNNAEIKENIIQNSIYGVDIEKGAVDIARLRFWLSLIVDEELPRPLPNLDFKIVVGNSLLPMLEDEVVDIDWDTKEGTSSNKAVYSKMKSDLQALVKEQKQYFSVKNEKEKAKLKQEIRELKIEILLNQLQLDRIKYQSQNTTNEELFGETKKSKEKELAIQMKLAGFGTLIKKLEHLKKHPNKPLQFFDWKLDFPEILNSSVQLREGFDIVIGNPPYINVELVSSKIKEAYKNKYSTIHKRYDVFGIFFENSLLNHIKNGVVTFIIPSQIMNNLSYSKLRDLILKNKWLKEVCYLGDKVFESANNDVCILILKKPSNNKIRLVNALNFKNKINYDVLSDYFDKSNNVLSITSSVSGEALFDKILSKNNQRISQSFDVFQGIVTGNNEAFILDEETIKNHKIESSILHPILHGRDFGKWLIRNTDRKILYATSEIDISSYPNANKWLTNYKKDLNKRRECINGVIEWYSLQWPRIKSQLDFIPKVIVQGTRNQRLKTRVVATIDTIGLYGSQGLNFIVPINKKDVESVYFLAGIINSELINYLFKTKFLNVAIKAEYIKNTPLPNANAEQRKQIIGIVKNILLSKDKDKPSQIYEHQLDVMVYQLYNLTYEEAKVIDPELSVGEFEKYRI